MSSMKRLYSYLYGNSFVIAFDRCLVLAICSVSCLLRCPFSVDRRFVGSMIDTHLATFAYLCGIQCSLSLFHVSFSIVLLPFSSFLLIQSIHNQFLNYNIPLAPYDEFKNAKKNRRKWRGKQYKRGSDWK